MGISICTLKFQLDPLRNGPPRWCLPEWYERYRSQKLARPKTKLHKQIQDGTIESLDDPLGKYLSWWTKNETDLRSTVTMRMLLSFTSGFGGGHPGEEMNTRQAREWRARNSPVQNVYLDACNATSGDVVECAKSIYENVKLIGTPGKVYSYV